ncbi:guanylate kinase, partial [Pyramidobacter piscolens]|uniref:guanylate kinase n=1 Tax=Pyramidobacter piscolens TaxID=638849 RepID=UPI003327F883
MTKNRKGTLFVLSGPSGAGKGTIRARVFEALDGLSYSVSCTTRAPREGERDGVDYRFITPEDFAARIAAGDFLEWADVHRHRYGTLKSDVEKVLNEGKDMFLEIDVQGALQVKKKMPEAVTLFVVPPSIEVLEERLRGRGGGG